MRASVFIATSVDGFIARPDGALDWLPQGDVEEHGYTAFFASVDALVIGRGTYETVLGFGTWPYQDKRVIVLSSRPLDLSVAGSAPVEQMSGDPSEIVARLDARGIKHAYIDGGVTIQRFLRARLIQRLTITRIPVLIGQGISLFGALDADIRLNHVATRHYASGLVQSEYEVFDLIPEKNLESISPFFIVKDLQASITHYIERFGFQLDFQGPEGDVYYGHVSRDGIGIMLKAITPDVPPLPNHARHEWARWDAYIYTRDPDPLFDEFKRRGASFVKELSYIDDGLWGFEVTDADGYVIAFFRTRNE